MHGALAGFIERNAATVRVATRASVAGVLSYAIAGGLGLPQPYWAVISALLVIQATVGASLQSSLDRLAGTIGGAVYGGLLAWLVPWHDGWSVLLTLAAALVPLTLLAASSSHYRVAPVTAVLVLVLPRGPEVGAVEFALDRIVEVALGGVVAVAVALLILPSRSRHLFAEAAARTFGAFADAVGFLPRAHAGGRQDPAFAAAMTGMTAKLAALDDAVTEIRRERRIRLSDDPDPAALIQTVRRTRTDIVMALRATAAPFPDALGAAISPVLDTVAAAVAAFLRALGDALDRSATPPSADAVRAALAEGKAELAAIRTAALAEQTDPDLAERLFSLGFALDQLNENLGQLAADCGPYLTVKPAAAEDA